MLSKRYESTEVDRRNSNSMPSHTPERRCVPAKACLIYIHVEMRENIYWSWIWDTEFASSTIL